MEYELRDIDPALRDYVYDNSTIFIIAKNRQSRFLPPISGFLDR